MMAQKNDGEGAKSETVDATCRMRPRSHSFKDMKDPLFIETMNKRCEETENENDTMCVQYSSRPRTRSFISDFRKFFSKSKTVAEAAATSIKFSQGASKENWSEKNNSVIEPRKKSRTWSHYEAHKILQKWRKPIDPSLSTAKRLYSPIRELQNSNSLEIMDGVGVAVKAPKNAVKSNGWQNCDQSVANFDKRWTVNQKNVLNKTLESQKSGAYKMLPLTDCGSEVKELHVHGRNYHLHLHQSYAVLRGSSKSYKLRISISYDHIQHIGRIYSREKYDYILIEMVEKKLRFTVAKHIFKDLYRLWRAVITAANRRKSISNGIDAQRTVSHNREYCQQANNNHVTDEMNSSDEKYFTSFSELMCASSSSSSLPSPSPVVVSVGSTDSEPSTAVDVSMDKCDFGNGAAPDLIDAKAPCECQSHMGRILLDEVYPLTTEQLFEILFSSTPWYHHLAEIVKKAGHEKTLGAVNGYMATSWMTESPTITSRTVTYTMALNNAIGPRSTSVTEKQIYSGFRGVGDGFSVVKEIQNEGIPCADSFTVHCTYCVIRAGNRHCRLLIHGAMVQNKSIWGIVKGIIEKSTYGGLESHYSVLRDTLKLLCGSQLSNDVQERGVSSSQPEKKKSIISDLVPNKLLHGTAIKSNCALECETSLIGSYQSIQSTSNSAKKTSTVTAKYDERCSVRFEEATKESRNNSSNFLSDKEIFGYNKLIIVLLLMLICLQIFTLLKISNIPNFHCSSINTASPHIDPLHKAEVPENVQNFNQKPETGDDNSFRVDL